MKINLTTLTLKPTIAGPEITQDLHKEIAEAIYQNASTLAEHSFALRLYQSDGEIEATDKEVGFIKAMLPGFRYFVQDAILKAIEER